MWTKRLWRVLTGRDSELLADGRAPSRYRTLRRNMIILMLVVTIVPLAIMAAINYLQYQKSLRSEIINPLLVLANKTRHSFEIFLEARLSNVRMIAFDYSFEELSDGKTMNRILRVLKQEVGGFIDLGLIDMTGTQVSYAGPYSLLGKNYSEQPWFHEVVLRGNYISEVFMGYRKFPHVAIAVQRPGAEGIFWILRATIDTNKFDNLIAAMGLDPESDAFLVNEEGILQTKSKFYGKVLEKCPISIPPGRHGANVVERVDPSGQEIIVAYTHFDHPDYTLLIVKPRSVLLRTWYTLKSDMLLVFLIGVGLIMLTVFRLIDIMVRRVQQADEKREEAFRELEHTHKLSSIGRLAAGVAHEINNPLAIIKEKAGLMKDLIDLDKSFSKRDKFLSQISSILQSVDRCRTITHRLLGFARRMEVQLEDLEVNDVIEETVGFLGKEAFFRNIEIRLNLAENLPRISSDRGQLQQVFLNILSNALVAVDDRGLIEIASRDHDPAMVCVAIRDNGCGMSQETLSRIFEPFFTTKKEYGTGLGLSITYGIVKKLGGDIKAESRLGEGTTFTVYLPKQPIQGLET